MEAAGAALTGVELHGQSDESCSQPRRRASAETAHPALQRKCLLRLTAPLLTTKDNMADILTTAKPMKDAKQFHWLRKMIIL